MFKLTIIAGPARGSVHSIKNGENVIGRVQGNDIVFVSDKVSKKHCSLVVNNTDVTLKDLGSSNGTFVNGVLTKLKKLMPGDKISVGDFVFELTRIEAPKPAPRPVQSSNVVAMPGLATGLPPMGIANAGVTGMTAISQASEPSMAAGNAPPQDLKEKVKFYFEKYVINFVFNLNEKHEWRNMMVGMFAVLTILGAILSVYPVLTRVDEKLNQEALYRTSFLARLVADRNAPFIFEKQDNKVDVGWAEKETGVLAVYVVDMEGRIMAPGRDLNQYLTEPTYAAFSAVSRQAFSKADRTSHFSRVYGDVLGVAEPIRIFSSSAGKNVSVALALVFFDRDQILFDGGTIALTYIQSIILSAIVAVIIFFSLYRLTLRPLNAINEEIDQVLKGNLSTVTKKFKMEEIGPLVDVINAALQRIPSGGTNGMGGGGLSIETNLSDEALSSLRFVGDRSTSGMLIFNKEKKIVYMNSAMEEITGIRLEAAKDQDVNAVARDAAFISFVEDVLGRAVSSPEPVVENFEFSGTEFKMECVCIGTPDSPKAFVLSAAKGAK